VTGLLVIFVEDIPQIVICAVYLINVDGGFNVKEDALTFLSILMSSANMVYNLANSMLQKYNSNSGLFWGQFKSKDAKIRESVKSTSDLNAEYNTDNMDRETELEDMNLDSFTDDTGQHFGFGTIDTLDLNKFKDANGDVMLESFGFDNEL
jgi:hypothetical protein